VEAAFPHPKNTRHRDTTVTPGDIHPLESKAILTSQGERILGEFDHHKMWISNDGNIFYILYSNLK
jgi:hypothetical protein